MKTTPLVRDYMTPLPITIGHDLTVAFANRRMHEAGVRHLPVLDAGRLVGLVSERDIALIEGLPGADTEALKVEDAMSEEVYAVEPDTTLAEAAEEMARRKIGSAIIVDGGKVIGVLTTVDMLRALVETLRTSKKVA